LANGLEHVGALAFSPENFSTPVRLMPTGYVPHANDPVSLEVIIEQTELILKDEADEEKLKSLLQYGPSLGGARPKYNIKMAQDFYLAKYSVSQDSRREQLIEFASMSMAGALGFNVPEIKIGKAFDRDVFYIKRFDREKGDKFPFVSALSLCEWDENGYQDWSYPIFCEALIKIGNNQKNIGKDLKELFRRIAFNIAINNNDDHPRNHGVLYQNGTWGLSPLYDVVPMDSNTQSFSLAMEVGLKKREASKSNLLSASKYFRLEENEASKLIDEIFDFVAKNWKSYFKKAGLTEAEIKRFENAMSAKL
jgi:serine/threonine-protein kinase HipA